MAKQTVGSPINWWGGKGSQAPRFIQMFPRHRKYVEVFGGAGHILFQKDKSKEEYYNDIHDGLISMFSVIQDEVQVKQLKRALELTPMSREEFHNCRDTWREEADPVEKARKFYVTVNQSFSSSLKNWKASRSGKGLAKNVAKFYSTIYSRLEFANRRMKDVTIERMDYKDLIKKHDAEDTLFYVDPPYVGETRTLQKGYDHEMTEVSLHEELVQLLLKMKGKVILSGYDHPVYDPLIEAGWKKVPVKEEAKSSAFTEVGEKKSREMEWAWVNYNIVRHTSNKSVV